MTGQDKPTRNAGKAGRARKGATGMEFGLMIGLVAVVAVAATATVGGKVREIFGGTSNAVGLGMNGMLPASGVNLASGVGNSAAPTINTSSLPSAVLGSAYAGASLSATTTPAGDAVSWALASGPLPTGMALSAAGVLSGTPTQAGTFPISVRATDTTSAMAAVQTLSLAVTALPVTISTSSVNPGAVGISFTQALSATDPNPTPTLSWTISSGSLPAGLSINGVTGTISGTPTALGTSTYTVSATDQYGVVGTSVYTQTGSLRKSRSPALSFVVQL